MIRLRRRPDSDSKNRLIEIRFHLHLIFQFLIIIIAASSPVFFGAHSHHPSRFLPGVSRSRHTIDLRWGCCLLFASVGVGRIGGWDSIIGHPSARSCGQSPKGVLFRRSASYLAWCRNVAFDS